MKQKLNRMGGMALLVLLITSLLAVFVGSGLVAANEASPVRDLPDEVSPGDEFQLTVTFTSPAANFVAIELADVAPAGWSVSVNKTWCTPDADADNNPTP
jgi:Na+/H+-dicarboxylate symporter